MSLLAVESQKDFCGRGFVFVGFAGKYRSSRREQAELGQNSKTDGGELRALDRQLFRSKGARNFA